ncbi:hypothetical protein BAE44_0002073 [Dichanthelium oligosanthes]|uniref:Uncharacterized protein n=1 Tax=Dichanthelium oligosanthes TaxID=888268 RepID=A0A1E5WHR9_9POAL|nr:hypothetical protein BAE44_0002073 [Dichanthelium oligosanthes]
MCSVFEHQRRPHKWSQPIGCCILKAHSRVLQCPQGILVHPILRVLAETMGYHSSCGSKVLLFLRRAGPLEREREDGRGPSKYSALVLCFILPGLCSDCTVKKIWDRCNVVIVFFRVQLQHLVLLSQVLTAITNDIIPAVLRLCSN